MWRLVSARVCVQDTGGCVPMPREAPGPSEHHLEGFSGGAGDDSVCCWGAGQRALASVALDFHARHWVPLFCYRSALKYPAFGHSVLKITSVGAVLFSQLIQELRGAAVKCSSSHLVAGRLLASCLTESPLFVPVSFRAWQTLLKTGGKCILAGSPLSIEFWILLGPCCALSLQARFQAPAKDVSVPWQPELVWDFWNGAGASQQGLPIAHPVPLLLSWLNFCHPLQYSDQPLGLAN